MDILTVFCEIDDFCNEFEPRFNQILIGDGKRQRNKPSAMVLSEVMTILVLFHFSGFRNLKTFYNGFVGQYLSAEFPHLSSYNRFVERERDALIPLWCYLHLRRGSSAWAKHQTPITPQPTRNEAQFAVECGTILYCYPITTIYC